MCISPIILDNGQETACHLCWQCREQRVNDWVGRNIAESRTAIASHAVTLTYGRSRAGDVDHERALILTYSDVQKFLKLLRYHKYSVRYFSVGEFGTRKGRAHWHIMLYWLDRVPPHELDKNFMSQFWPHGWSFWTSPSPHAVRYNCKYIQKDIGEAERQGHLAMSKKPPLGAAYFRGVAEQWARQGLAPQAMGDGLKSFGYRFPDVRRRGKSGQEVVEFALRDKSLELFLGHFVACWEAYNPGVRMPSSKLLDEFTDPGAWRHREDDGNPKFRIPDVSRPCVTNGDLYSWMSDRSVVWSKEWNRWEAPGPPGGAARMRWVYIDTKGAYGWRSIHTRQAPPMEGA